jgi:RNA polymerase sigma factor (sigma-70 family)
MDGARAPTATTDPGMPVQTHEYSLTVGTAMGDQALSVAFLRRYQRRAFGLAYSMTSDASLAEVVAEEALIRICRHPPVFDRRRDSVESWVLLAITRDLTINKLRMRRTARRDPDDFVASTTVSLEHNPEDAVLGADTSHEVRSALLDLPPERRRVLVLAAVYERTALEISEQEGIPLGIAKTQIRTGLSRVRTAVGRGRRPAVCR